MESQFHPGESNPTSAERLPSLAPIEAMEPPGEVSARRPESRFVSPVPVVMQKRRVSNYEQVRVALASHDPARRDWTLYASRMALLFSSAWSFVEVANAEWLPTLVASGVTGLLWKLNRYAGALEKTKTALDFAQFDARHLGAVIQLLHSTEPRLRDVAGMVLTRLLPNLEPDAPGGLTPHNRAILYQQLRPGMAGRNPALTLAILNALEKVGDDEAVSAIEPLAEGRSRWLTPAQRRLRDAARDSLVVIEERLDFQRGVEAKAGRKAAASEGGEVGTLEMRMASADVESQLARLEAERKQHQQPGMRMAFLVASWCSIVPYTGTQGYLAFAERNWLQGLTWLGLFAAATQMHRFALTPAQTEAARKLAAHDDVRGVGKLAEALEWPDEATRQIAASALARLLPRLNFSDANLLDARQRAILYKTLRLRDANYSGELQIAILTALQQIGDEEAVPVVQRLAHGLAFSPRQKRVRKAAEECLPFLKDRASLTRASQTLLRASSSSEQASQALLRAARNPEETDPAQLLRASLSERSESGSE